MLNARVATLALLGLLVTGVAYAVESGENGSDGMAAPAQAEVLPAQAEVLPAQAEIQPEVADQVLGPAPVDAVLDEGATAENVVRATITTSIVDREPVDSVDTVTNDQEVIFFFTEVMDLMGGTITHRWEYNGEIMAEVPLEIGGPRWRTHSSKRLFRGWIGEWKVSVVDDLGHILRSVSFNYVPSGTPAAPDKN